MTTFRLKILTPVEKHYDEEALSVTVRGEDGWLTVLPEHALMVCLLTEGAMVVRTRQETLEGMAGEGVLQVKNDEVIVMVHSFHWKEEETAEEAPAEDVAKDAFL